MRRDTDAVNIRRNVLVTLAVIAVGACVCTTVATATEAYQGVLPQYENSRFGCLTCHTVETPTSINYPVNAFGEDFIANSFVWNEDLAALNSDGDGCTNGAELGDSDGDGVLDGNVTQESGNPGVKDECASHALTEATTWGALRDVFRSN